MTGKTHIAAGIATCIVLTQVTGLHEADTATLIVGGICGAILPDICHAGSKIGRRFPLLAKVTQLLFGHRTVTHSLLFVIVVWHLLASYGSYVPAMRDGVVIGMISHLVLDAATAGGIALYWPLRQKIRLPLYTKTGSLTEHALFVLCSAIIMWFGSAVLFAHPFDDIFSFRFTDILNVGHT